MAKTFEDIGKDTADFFSKGFPNSGTFKLSAETKTPNGVTVTSTGTRSFAAGGEENLVGTVEPKFDWKDQGAELTGKLSTLGEFEAGVSFKDVFVKGSKLAITGIQSDKDGTSLKPSIAFKNDLFSAKAGFKYPFKLKTHINWNGEVVFRYPDHLFWGVDLRHDTAVRGTVDTPEADQPTDQFFWNAKAGISLDTHHIHVGFENVANKDKKTNKANPSLHNLNVGFFQTVSESIKVAWAFSAEVKNVKGIEFNAGGEYKVDKDTLLKSKFSFAGAKDPVDREFRFGLGVKQTVSEHTTVTVGADVNARSLLGGPNINLGSTKPHSFGFEVKFTQ